MRMILECIVKVLNSNLTLNFRCDSGVHSGDDYGVNWGVDSRLDLC